MAKEVSQPEVTLNILAAKTIVANTAQKVLIVGQQSGGTAVTGELQSSIQADGSEDALFGANSRLAGAIRAFRKLNDQTQVDAIGIDDDGSGVDATGTVDFTGTATAAGEFVVDIGSSRDYQFSVPVAIGDTATVVGDALAALIAADPRVPVTAANVTGTVTMTTVNAGTEGNEIGLRITGIVAGLTLAVTAMTGGTTNPTLTGVFDVVGDTRYQTVLWPFTFGTTELTDFLDPRFNTDNAVRDGVGIMSGTDTFANFVASGAAENSQSLLLLADELVVDTLYKGPSIFELADVRGAQLGAIRSLRLTDGTSIARFITTTNGARDSFGGPALASFPYFNTPFPNLPVLDVGKGFTDVEVETLLTNGVSVVGNNLGRTGVIANEMVTTYKTDAASNPDPSFKNLNNVDTISNIREFYFNNLKKEYSQSRLTEGPVIGGRAMANKEIIGAFCNGLYNILSGVDFTLTQAGETAAKFYKENLIITVSLVTGRVTLDMKTPIVTQLREIIGSVQITFSTEG